MNLAETADLVVRLSLKDELSRGVGTMKGKLRGLNLEGASLRGGFDKIGQGIKTGFANALKIGAVGVGALIFNVVKGIGSLADLEDTMNQTKAVLKSTGSVAGLTAEDIRAMSEELEDLTTIDDKVIQGGANLLLTFKAVKKDAFEPAMQAALDLSVAMEQDLEGSIIMVGKALNDPIRGLTAMRRVGIQFTAEQEAVIKSLVETGDVAGAQAVILEELNSQFGGSAQAAAGGYRGTLARLGDTVEELQMALAEALFPAIKRVSDKLREFLKTPEVKEGIKKLGEAVAGLFSDENLKGGGDIMRELFGFLRDLPWSTIREGLSFAAENAKKVVDVFKSLPPGVQQGLLAFLAANKLTGGLVSAGLGELLKVGLRSLTHIMAGNVTVVGTTVTAPGAGAGPAGAAGRGGLVAPVTAVIAGVTGAVVLDVVDKENAETGRQGVEQMRMLVGNATEQQQQDAGFWGEMLGHAANGMGLIPIMQETTASVREGRDVMREIAAGTDRLGAIEAAIPASGQKIAAAIPISGQRQINAATAVAERDRALYRALAQQQFAKLDANRNGVVTMKEALAAKLGVSIEELRGVNRKEQTVAERLGLSLEQLRELKAAARLIADRQNTTNLRLLMVARRVAPRDVFSTSGVGPGRQHGGPVSPYETYVVGERGPERLHMGSRRGWVDPGRSQPVQVQVTISARDVISQANRYPGAHVPR